MTTLDKTTEIGQQVDTAFHYGGLLFRAVGYLFVYAIADRYDCGPAILTGVLVGDFLGQVMRIIWDRSQTLLVQLGELFTLGVFYLFVHSMIVWPDDPAMRAILGLSAFGLLVGHISATMLTRLGPSDT